MSVLLPVTGPAVVYAAGYEPGVAVGVTRDPSRTVSELEREEA